MASALLAGLLGELVEHGTLEEASQRPELAPVVDALQRVPAAAP